MRTITLSRGKVALLDDDDYERLMRFTWHSDNFYARRYLMQRAGKTIQIFMHREILGLENGDARRVDHIDGNGLNNQRSNLRFAVQSENMWNRKKHSNNKTGFKGVDRRCGNGKFRATIRKTPRRIYLGDFRNAEEAARAYDKAAVRLHGAFACLNFPEHSNETASTAAAA